jgi:hypothetical protein
MIIDNKNTFWPFGVIELRRGTGQLSRVHDIHKLFLRTQR